METEEENEETEDSPEDRPEVKIAEARAEFEEIMVWGHEALPEDTADPYVRGLEEWISFAEQVC